MDPNGPGPVNPGPIQRPQVNPGPVRPGPAPVQERRPLRVGAPTVIAVAIVAIALIGAVLYFGQRTPDPTTAATSTSLPGSSPSPTTRTPAPLTSEQIRAIERAERIAWAGQVCRARDRVKLAVAVLPGLALEDILSSMLAPDDASERLQAGLDDLTGEMDGLGRALGRAPIDYVEAGDAIAQVSGEITAFTQARDAAATSIGAIGDARNPLDLVPALQDAASNVRQAYEAGQSVLTTLDEVSSPTRGELKDAFRAATPCRERPAPSSAGS